MRTTALVVAKAPVPGRAKTRLAADLGADGHTIAARIAAAALLDTIDACSSAFHARRIALAGDLTAAVDGERIRTALGGWRISTQRGDGLGARLAHAHGCVDGPVLQVGMDTPQATPALLRETVALLDRHDAVLGPADDGGWWVLALRDPRHARVLADVEMSTPRTYDDTRRALEADGLSVGRTAQLRDVDHLADLASVAALVPTSRFARRVATLLPEPVA